MSLAPLTPLQADLRDYPFMPLRGERLFLSESWILCGDAGRAALMTLLWRAWHELPAGSLPADDRLLAALAGYGVAVEAWRGIRDEVMRCWVLCSNGRYYHALLAEEVNRVWAERCRKDEARAQAAERKRRQRARARGEAVPSRAAARDGLAASSVPFASVTLDGTGADACRAGDAAATDSGSAGTGAAVAGTDPAPAAANRDRDGVSSVTMAPVPRDRGDASAGRPADPGARGEQSRVRSTTTEGGGGDGGAGRGGGHDADAVAGVIAAFDAARARFFRVPQRAGPELEDPATAAAWLALGLAPAAIAQVIEAQMKRLAGKGLAAPWSLAFCDRDVRASAGGADADAAADAAPLPADLPPWQRVLAAKVGTVAWHRWCARLQLGPVTDGQAQVLAPTPFMRDWLRAHLEPDIAAALREAGMGAQTVELAVAAA